MIIEIDDEFADSILVGVLAESYVRIKDMMKNANAWHPEDVAIWKDLIPAMELVGSHFSTDFKAEIKKASAQLAAKELAKLGGTLKKGKKK